ncbi:septum site-determining protein MinC [Caminicella sporogenes DSM 14501]|uniref:Probable septum site-determining protein MinC n=1 Tax=Caminicella sporogenes DSM 14501 TaxID=1121266 RepID=A0A1M6LWE6_9FIRM|nr:septum site-determining protein MinC [Caminicella sporogenes]RKD27974.1 septum site-determining protein MinC [Caminicella sporogenes]SHJ75471.1 septum site-determining protein MinC [Caminicella sporogenes DSM 14501]
MDLKNYVEFKGTKDGLVLLLNETSDFESIKRQLIERLEKAKNFFEGAKVKSIQGKLLSKNEEDEIIDIINNKYGMIMVREEIKSSAAEKSKIEVFEGLEEGITKFVNSTLRSGTKIEFEGNLVIIGDINPGAEVRAHGNIVVMGVLRGIAHAGANGNRKAFVTALKLIPTQLRIADYIARSPDSNIFNPKYPEIAFIKNDMIVIEPYLTKKR